MILPLETRTRRTKLARVEEQDDVPAHKHEIVFLGLYVVEATRLPHCVIAGALLRMVVSLH